MPPIYYFLISFLSSLFFLSLKLNKSLIFLAFFLVFLFLAFKKRSLGLFFLLILSFLLAHWRLSSFNFDISNNPWQDSFSSEVKEWDWEICSDPEPNWKGQDLVLCQVGVKNSRARVSARVDLYPRVYYGDRIRLKCRLEEIKDFSGFSYSSYLADRGIRATCVWPIILSVERSEIKTWRLSLLRLKSKTAQILDQNLAEPSAGLAKTLFLGYKKTFHPSEEQAWKLSGLNHLIAISGTHINIFLLILSSSLISLGLRRSRALLISLILMFNYLIIIGFRPSALRSLLMSSFIIYAWQRGRLVSNWNIFLWVLFIILWSRPLIWQHDLGFQLSFLAYASIIALSTPIRKFLDKLFYRRTTFLSTALSLSLAAQLGIWPLLALKTGGVSLVAPLSNLLAFFVVPPLIFALILASFLANLGISFSILWAFTYSLLSYLLDLARISSQLSWAYLEVEKLSVYLIALYYIALLIYARRAELKSRLRKK